MRHLIDNKQRELFVLLLVCLTIEPEEIACLMASVHRYRFGREPSGDSPDHPGDSRFGGEGLFLLLEAG